MAPETGMTKHNHSQHEIDLMVQRAQNIARKHTGAGKTLISEELIRERRAEARREMKEINQGHLNHFHK